MWTERRTAKHMKPLDRVVWGADYPENVVAIVNILCGIQVLNPYVHTLNLAPFGRTLISIIPQEGVWGAFFLFLGICHYVVRNGNDNRRPRRAMCFLSLCVWTIVWALTVIADWRGLGVVILLVLVVNSWVAFRRLSQRKVDGLWYAQRKI